MAPKNETLQSKQRLRILDAYRGRGRRNNNLYLIYSVKTDRDWILSSDRQFIHWLHFLEANSNVKTFDLAPERVILNDGVEMKDTELDAIVELQDSTVEWHKLNCDPNQSDKTPSQMLAQAAASSIVQVKYKVYTDAELRPVVQHSMRWFKALTFAATLRESSYTNETSLLCSYLEQAQAGVILDIANGLKNEFNDIGILFGLLTRLSVRGFLSLDLTKYGLCMSTPWRWGKSNVV